MERGAFRNVERIEEEEPGGGSSVSAFLLVALGGAAVVLASVVLGGRRSTVEPRRVDPLAELVAQRGAPAASARPGDLSAHDVTFPGLLSDQSRPATVLAAVRGGAAPAASAPAEPTPMGAVARDDSDPPPPGDRLPVVPLPASQVLQPSPLVTRPRDALTKAATEAGQITTPAAPAVAAGHEGGYQLQVSSFRTGAEAQAFADQLRARGHKAYVSEAHVTGRGTWYRVRVGPFATQQAAAAYRVGFEAREHVVPFVVSPR